MMKHCVNLLSLSMTLTIVIIGSTNSSLGATQNFIKLKNRHCELYKKDSKFKHFEEAVTACRHEPQCMAVYDQYCSNKDFHLCDNGLVKQSTLGSCVYIIGNTTVKSTHAKTADSCLYEPCGESCTLKNVDSGNKRVCQPDRTCGTTINPNCPSCRCNSTIFNGYGNCQKRSQRLGGNFFCVVNQNSSCSDKIQYPETAHFLSVQACHHFNKADGFRCSSKHCRRELLTFGLEYGFYNISGDCELCKTRCRNDSSCGGIECGRKDNQCMYWKKGECGTLEKQIREDPTYKTCMKYDEGIFPNNFKKKDPKFTAVFYNLLPYNIDLYGVEFEGRKHQITKELETGHRRKEITSLSIPWVFKQSGKENRLLAFIGSSYLSFFKGETLGLKEGSTIHLTINENVTTCTCMDTSVFRGNEICQLQKENDFPTSQMCYVKLPSDCKSLQNSTKYLGFLMSSDPCSTQQMLQKVSKENSPTNDDWIWKSLIGVGIVLVVILSLLVIKMIKRPPKIVVQLNERNSMYSLPNSTTSTQAYISQQPQNDNYLTPIFSESSQVNSPERGTQNVIFPAEVNPRERLMRSVSADLRNQIVNHARTSKREIQRSIFSMDDQIGKGNFGKVFKGHITGLYHPSSQTVVAIKGIKSKEINEVELEYMLSEIKIMNNISPNLNLVSMVASCTSDFEETGNMYLLLEYCKHGDLKNYLIVKSKEIQFGKENDIINSRCLIKWANDVANGMHYLDQNKIMHGDLAARNVLMDDNIVEGGYPVAKVADFGLSKELNDYLIYEKEVRLHVPWRWMAPEYLNARYFTDTSDVWSFGVLFWEILSLGKIPYGHQGYDEVVMNLKTGYRLPCPDGLEYITLWRPEKLYESISKTCFIANPNKRGTFSDVVQILRSELTEEELLFYEQMTENYKSKRSETYLKINKRS